LSVTTAAAKRERRSWVGDSPAVPPLITLLALFLIFSIAVPNFGTMRTVSGIVGAGSINALVVIGVTMLMICGEFDLSVGSMLAVAGLIFAKQTMAGGSPVLAVGMALLAGALMGLFNGLLTTSTGIPSFIATLGTRSIYRAIAWVYSGGLMLQTNERLPAYDFLNGRLDSLNNVFFNANFRTATLWALIVVIIAQVILVRTQFGNQVFATGGSPGAARALGINVRWVKLACFTLTGLLCGMAGVLTFSQFRTIFVASGAGLELTAIASAVVGGTLLAGGVGSIVGGLIGLLLINMLRSGAVLMGLPSDNFEAIVGVTIIGAAIINERLRERF